MLFQSSTDSCLYIQLVHCKQKLLILLVFLNGANLLTCEEILSRRPRTTCTISPPFRSILFLLWTQVPTALLTHSIVTLYFVLTTKLVAILYLTHNQPCY